MSDQSLKSSLRELSLLLCRHYGQQVIILIDEYDVPLAKANERGYYDRMALLIRNMFEAALKTNDNLHFAVLTGCLRVAKGSIFTGLNNFSVFSITDMDFDEYFGFTDMEKTVSIRDTFVRKPAKENFYHGMLLGILGFKEGWTVTSNKEAGDGFSDIMIRIDDVHLTKGQTFSVVVTLESDGTVYVPLDTDEDETLMTIRELLSFLPSNNMEDAPKVACSDDIRRTVESLQTVIPEDPNIPYDIKDIIEPVLDNQYFFEVMPHFAKNVVIGFGRLNGRSVGIVANQPAFLAGVLDIDASDKAARFIRFCDCFNIPIITFEDVPGFLPGTQQEHNGIIRHGAKIVYAYAEATVPKITLITRKAYGGAYIVMSSKPTGADVNLAYPQAEIAVMGAAGAVNILYRKASPEEKAGIIRDYEEKFSNPYRAAERGLIDEVIMPRDTRYKLIQALEMCQNKNQSNPPKKHGNMPL